MPILLEHQRRHWYELKVWHIKWIRCAWLEYFKQFLFSVSIFTKYIQPSQTSYIGSSYRVIIAYSDVHSPAFHHRIVKSNSVIWIQWQAIIVCLWVAYLVLASDVFSPVQGSKLQSITQTVICVIGTLLRMYVWRRPKIRTYLIHFKTMSAASLVDGLSSSSTPSLLRAARDHVGSMQLKHLHYYCVNSMTLWEQHEAFVFLLWPGALQEGNDRRPARNCPV